MTRHLSVGIVDYGVGNHASVANVLRRSGFRCYISSDPEVLESKDCILLPGVGAFPSAMDALCNFNLVEFIRGQAQIGKPLLGICLGMHLLAERSEEIEETTGIGLLPGRVASFSNSKFHIGWNALEIDVDEPLLQQFANQAVYFNHSYILNTLPNLVVAHARFNDSAPLFAAIVRKSNIVGIQFHPEKSQTVGSQMLQTVITDLCSA